VRPYHRRVYDFECTGDEIFPPLESLSLNRHMSLEEWPHWRDKLDWSILTSFSMGPLLDNDLLGRLTGCATALRNLTVETWAREQQISLDDEGPDGESCFWQFEDGCPELEGLLLASDNLERLTIRGISVINHAVTKHSGLKELCLHAIELSRNGAPRPALDVADLKELDASCPDLETLEIDINRDSEWVSAQSYRKHCAVD
jgi:hypothetical protein